MIKISFNHSQQTDYVKIERNERVLFFAFHPKATN